jgi:prepilin-type N-terminal cleavage/methylation domain-containing protein
MTLTKGFTRTATICIARFASRTKRRRKLSGRPSHDEVPRGQRMERKGFTLLELLVSMSILLVLVSISLPCLLRAKDSALQLVAMEVGVNEEGKVFLEINDRSNRKPTDDIYMIKIDRPRKCHVRLKEPLPSGMKLKRKDGQDYIMWRPKMQHLGRHPVTAVFEGEETSEREIVIYVFNKELLEAQREDKKDPH